jgi:hypothetical protein
MEDNEKLYWEVVHARWAHDYLEQELEAMGLKPAELVSSKEAYDAETRACMAQLRRETTVFLSLSPVVCES